MLRMLLIIGCMTTMIGACNTLGPRQDATANVRIYGLEGFDFDHYDLNITAIEASNALNMTKQGRRGDQELRLILPPATYRVDLSLYVAAELAAGSSFCPEREKQSNVFAVLPGLNDLRVIICNNDATTIGDAARDPASHPSKKAAADSSTNYFPSTGPQDDTSTKPASPPARPQTDRAPASVTASPTRIPSSINATSEMKNPAAMTMKPQNPATSSAMEVANASPTLANADLDITPILRSPSGDRNRGRSLYQAQCAACHGNMGTGGSAGPALQGPSCISCKNPEQFIEITAEEMPPRNPNTCDKTCARDIAAYILTL